MEQEKKQAVALMRYSAIAPIITGTQEDYESLSAYFRTASAKGIKAPDGSLRHYSPGTLEKWYLAYKKSGFDALIPSGRSDCGVSRKIDDDLREQIVYLRVGITNRRGGKLLLISNADLLLIVCAYLRVRDDGRKK